MSNEERKLSASAPCKRASVDIMPALMHVGDATVTLLGASVMAQPVIGFKI